MVKKVFRNFHRKRRGRKGKHSKNTLAHRIDRQILKRQETKFLQLFSGLTAVTTGGPTNAYLLQMAQGTGEQQRVGSQILITAFKFRFAINENLTGQCSRMRFIIMRDKKPNNTLVPPISDVDWFASKTLANAWFSGYDIQTVPSRYQVLMDKSVNLNTVGGATDQGQKKSFVWNHYKKYKVTFNANAGTPADVTDGQFILAIYSDAGANGPFYSFEMLMKYKDA